MPLRVGPSTTDDWNPWCSVGVIKPGLYAVKVRALLDAAELRAKGGNPVVEVMIR